MKKLINRIANIFRKKSEDSNNGSEIYEYHALIKEDGQYKIIWSRDGKSFEYEISETLANKSRKSSKDALEVMFYVEHNRWPQKGELDNYHQVKVKTYRGSLFSIYVEDDKYEIGFESEHDHMNLGDEKFPITKELKEKAFKSYEDAEAVMWYALTGAWLSDGKEEVFRRFFRRFPKFILVNPEKYKGLFSEEEYEHILTVAKETEEKWNKTFQSLSGLNPKNLTYSALQGSNSYINAQVQQNNKEAVTETQAIMAGLSQAEDELKQLREQARHTEGQRDLAKINAEINAVTARIEGFNSKLTAIQVTNQNMESQAKQQQDANRAEFNFAAAKKFSESVVNMKGSMDDLPSGYESRSQLMKSLWK